MYNLSVQVNLPYDEALRGRWADYHRSSTVPALYVMGVTSDRGNCYLRT